MMSSMSVVLWLKRHIRPLWIPLYIDARHFNVDFVTRLSNQVKWQHVMYKLPHNRGLLCFAGTGKDVDVNHCIVTLVLAP